MTRTVIRIEEFVNLNDDRRVVLRPEEPIDVKDYGSNRELACRVGKTPFSDLAAVAPGFKGALPNPLVRQVGESLYQGLSVHDGVIEAIDRAAKTLTGEVHHIFLSAEAMDAEALPFEVLYHPKAQFLGLDPRWPISRIVGPRRGRIFRYAQLPIRMAAILAAADRDAIPEWESLRSAIVASKLPVAVTVFAARDDLAAHVAAQADPWVTHPVERVPDTPDDVIQALTKLRPQLLHIFSHGSSQYQGYVELATRNSLTFGQSPVYLTAQQLAQLRDVVWLVTVNACEGAAPAAKVHSLAYAMVEEGVPATIAMREVIDSADASCFCESFYGSALSTLAGLLVPGARVKPDWSEALRQARAALCAKNPGPTPIAAASSKPWTLPVLHRRAAEFVVQVWMPGLTISDTKQARLFADIDNMYQARDRMLPETPASMLALIDGEIANLRAQLV